ncbi:Bacteriophage CII protein [Phytobacter ursingii]|nr:Bacteriophage CII protein [Phytobacter ursingii]
MDNANTRNKVEARRIQSWLLNQISIRGTSNVAKAVGVDKSQISRWKEQMLPKMAMLLAVLEWGVVDDDMARLAKEVAALLTKTKRPVGKTERDDQIDLDF